MSRGAIYAGKAAILLTVQDQIDRGLVAARNKLRAFSNTLGDIGSGALRGGFLGSIGSGFMLKRFSDFSDELLNLQVKLGYFGNITTEQAKNIDGLIGRVRELGKTTSFTSKQVAEAATQLAQAGFSIGEIKNSLQPVLDLARGTGFGLAESAAMMANAIRTFNLDTKQANTVVSQFVKATRLGTIEIQDLQEALKYASGSAVNLEQTLPTLLGLFVQMSEAGLKGSLAGTSLNTAMLNLVKNFESMEQTLSGFQLIRNRQGMLDLVATLESLYNATAKMDKLQRVATFQDIFNIRGARAIASTQEIERVIRFAREIQNAGNEARLAALTMDSGLGGAARRATSALDDFGKTIGFIVDKPLQGLLEAVPVAIGHLDTLARKFPAVTIGVVALPFALAGAGIGLLSLSVIMRKTAGVVDLLLGGFRRLANVASAGTLKQLGFLKGATLLPRTKGLGGKKPTSLSQLKGIGAVLGNLATQPTQASRAATATRQAATVWKDRALILSQAKGFERRAEALKKNLQYERALLGAMKARGIASPATIAAQAAKVTNLGLRVSAAKSNASALRGIAGGMKLFPGLRLGAGIAQIGKNLLTLAKGFWAVTRGVTRFIFSFNGVWTIFELLLLFGNKIPFIAKGLERLSRGFSLAFQEIGRIAPLAQSSLQLIGFGIRALAEGEGANSQLGFTAIVEGVKSLANVVGNQLSAAWQRVVIAVAPFYDVVRKIVSSLYEVVALTLQMALNFAGGRFKAISQIFGGSGIGDWNTTVKEFLQGLGWVIGSAFGVVDRLASVFDDFLYQFQLMMINILDKVPVFGLRNDDAAAMKRDAWIVKAQQDIAHAGRIQQRQAMFEEFWDRVEEIFTKNTEAIAKGKLGGAHAASQNAAAQAQQTLDELSKLQQQFLEARRAEIAQLQASTTPGISGGGGAAITEQRVQLAKLIHSIVGSAHDTRQNLLLKHTLEKQSLDEEKEQTNQMRQMNGNLETIKRNGGTLVFQH